MAFISPLEHLFKEENESEKMLILPDHSAKYTTSQTEKEQAKKAIQLLKCTTFQGKYLSSAASSQISSAQQDSCPTHTKHETIEPSKVKIRASPSTRLFDSRSNAKTNGEQQLPSVPELPWNSTRLRSEQKAKTWVVKENKEEPWNMEKVLEELGEVFFDKCI